MDVRPLSTTQLVMLGCAPLLMVVVSAFERRWGPRVAGVVAAAPVTGFVGLLLVHSRLGATDSAAMALRMSGYLPAQVATVTAIALLVTRLRFPLAVAAGVASYVLVAGLSLVVPPAAAVAVSLVVIVAARRLRLPPAAGGVEPAPAAGLRIGMIAVRAGVSLLTALALLLTAEAFGPSLGGAVGAFPMFSVTLCAFVHRSLGAPGAQRVLSGVVGGLLPYLTFMLTYGLALPRVGVVAASLAALTTCALSYPLTRSPAASSSPASSAPSAS